MYMIYQQYTTAIKNAYAGHADVHAHLAAASAYREWLESLEISATIRATLVEQAKVLEEAFSDLAIQLNSARKDF